MDALKQQGESPGHSHTNEKPALTFADGTPFPDPLVVKNIPPGVHHKFLLRMPIFATKITMKVSALTPGVCTDFDITGLIYVKEKNNQSSLDLMPRGGIAAGYLLAPAPQGSQHLQSITLQLILKPHCRNWVLTGEENVPDLNPYPSSA